MSIPYKAIDAMMAALKKVGDEHGVTFEITKEKSRVDATSFLIKATSKDDSAVRSAFERHCEGYGFKKEDFKRRFVFRGSVYTLTGFDVGKPKYAVVAYHEDGRRFGFPYGISRHITWAK